jgi:hypothetical protein
MRSVEGISAVHGGEEVNTVLVVVLAGPRCARDSGRLGRRGGITAELEGNNHRGPMIGALGALPLGPPHAKGDPHQVGQLSLGGDCHRDGAQSRLEQFRATGVEP